MSYEAGLEQPLEQATQPPLWASPSLRRLAPSFVLGQVRAQYTLLLYVSFSISNRIENPLIDNFKI